MSQPFQDDESARTDRLPEQVEPTHDDLGRPAGEQTAGTDAEEQAGEKVGEQAGEQSEEKVGEKVGEKAAAWKEQAVGTAAHLADRLREKAGRAAELARDRTPDPVLDKAGRAAAQVRDTAAQAGQLAAEKTPERLREQAAAAATTAASAARANRAPLLAGAAVLVVTLFLLRGRGHK
ncbi:hypothetical protein [Kitasatospora phosalacinea]|uniref:DUF3618 domain-containing protein n=1 Tax=Kitasatospora phosalacinea TaxID=2065 RepID=A0A9W6PJQ3_9ACTN|nr:hypothetical protein [Kitasatospora phosalacinea]GLW56133.1 hypothetical protein Kpho01_41440 [Kitasatospora phosalacinea]